MSYGVASAESAGAIQISIAARIPPAVVSRFVQGMSELHENLVP